MPRQSPVEEALAKWESWLVARRHSGRTEPIPPERVLARLWNLSHAAVNRATHRLIAQGRLRRQGYRLEEVPAQVGRPPAADTGATVLLSQRLHRSLAAFRRVAERRSLPYRVIHYAGRDSCIAQLESLLRRPPAVLCYNLSGDEPASAERLRAMEAAGSVCVALGQGMAGGAQAWSDPAEEVERATRHLYHLGHRDLAVLARFPSSAEAATQLTAYKRICGELSLMERVVWSDLAQESWGQLRERHKDLAGLVSGLIVLDCGDAQRLARSMQECGTSVPRDISVLTIGDLEDATGASCGFSSVSFDIELAVELALDLAARRRRSRPASAPPERVRLESRINDRGSLAPVARPADAPDAELATSSLSTVTTWPTHPAERLARASAMCRQPYPGVRTVSSLYFRPLDLRPFFNRSYQQTNAWVADLPLLHFPMGKRVIHGVPFQIGPAGGGPRSGILLRSKKTSRVGQDLPVEIVIPVRRYVVAVYVLHMAGFAGIRREFASYEFGLADGKRARVPIVTRGWREVAGEPTGQEPNIQDWWYEFPQIDGAQSRRMVVTEGGDPFLYERYLYTLEWKNPESDGWLEHIRVRSDPEADATLGILAMTLHLT